MEYVSRIFHVTQNDISKGSWRKILKRLKQKFVHLTKNTQKHFEYSMEKISTYKFLIARSVFNLHLVSLF